jgi:phenylalanyl-tRNA synthetase beta chain
MKVVVSWLREFAPTDLDADDLAERIDARGVKIEGVLRPWAGLDGVVVARVVDVADHPDSDKLCVARVHDGTGEHVVVVGVRNMRAGDLVPWAPPGARVPVLPDPLEARTLRGVVSNGMLCSPRELAISEDHGGILLLNDEGLESGADVRSGLGLDDAVLDIEVEPNRPDFLSVYGVAREVAAATGVPLRMPDLTLVEDDEAAASVAGVELKDPDGCPRYLARVIRGVRHRASPLRAQARLSASGMRPISAVVDATNYAMLELGQPLHGFDLASLAGPGIMVRRAEEGERLVTLDDVERTLTAEDLLICDLEGPVALAGVMGGARAEVSDATTDVLLESAYFTRTGILRTARRLDLHSEASHRFERGTDPEGLERAATRCARLIADWTGGRVLRGEAEAGSTPPRRRVSMRPARAGALIGYRVALEDATRVFDALGMAHSSEAPDRVEVEVPGYRVDIEHEVDLIEEVARIQGYDRIGSTIPTVRQSGGQPPAYTFARRLRDILLRAGLHEARLLSFASREDLALTGDEAGAIRVANPLQADESALRTRLTPGLLHAAARNRARGVRTVELFEVGTVFRPGAPVEERRMAAFVLTGPAAQRWDAPPRSYDALDAKGVVEALMDELRIDGWSLGDPPGSPMHPGRSASVLIDGAPVGIVGELHPRRAEELELEGRVALAELEIGALMDAADAAVFRLAEVPRFPPVRRDLAFVVNGSAPAGAVQDELEAAVGDLLGSCELFDVHRGPPLADGTKSLAFALELRAPDRTLTSEEADAAIAAGVDRLAAAFGATLRAG